MLEAEVVRQLKSLGTSTLFEAQGKKGALPGGIRPIWRGAFVAGPAYTVRMEPGDNLALHHAVVLAAPGDVLVADCAGFADSGVWGEVLTVAAMNRGLAGLIVNGSVRDIVRLEALGFPVFSCGVSMGGTSKGDSGAQALKLSLGNVVISPGDIIVADSDGVLAIEAQLFEEVLQSAHKREEQEKKMMQALRNGGSTIDLMGLTPPNS